ncbi:hypothetical protein M9H77_10128 [Catharanthus roseus]|uniref:Uncharacterized protein n=1 Tax=Catharanthus roseus TaxID=4058 RepID=A0ACC0C2G7_CATRO|nr:hypothetical protein M9H77_10128 [Catharanthus roseus]
MARPYQENHEDILKAQTVVEFALENLKLISLLKSVALISERNEIESLYTNLQFLQNFIKGGQESFNQDPSFSEQVEEIFQVVDELLVATDSAFYSNLSDTSPFLRYSPGVADLVQNIILCFRNSLYSTRIADLVLEIREIFAGPKTRDGIVVITDSGFYGDFLGRVDFRRYSPDVSGLLQTIGSMERFMISAIVVGFEDETRVLRDRLIAGRMRLEVVPIVGMAGIGKTTIANKLFNDLSINYRFHIRAWTTISQAYGMRKSLHSILSSILNENDPVFDMGAQDIGEKLRKCLKGNRYLIVIDDIWDKQTWNELKVFFPDDGNGSRILTTSRIVDVVANASTDKDTHFLRVLTSTESYALLKQKVFADKIFPEELDQIGKLIVEKCKGLPLAIVVVSGLLAQREKTQDCWRHVADSISSSVDNEFGQIMDILALSYTDLPPHLKSCFLYLGSFPEDYEIPVKGLLRTWIAEGFVEHWDQKVLEDVAENYLINLINRSLIIVAKKSSVGGIKSCHLHDVLHDFCRKKSNEKKFLQLLCKCEQNPYPVYRFSDCQYFHSYKGCYVTEDSVSNTRTLAVYRFLKVLDLRHIMLDKFPGKILELIHLRLLALWVDRYQHLPQAIFRLRNLETFILDGDKAGLIKLSNQILKMARLRHVQISKELLCDEWNWVSTDQSSIYSSVLENLQTLSRVCPSGFFYILLSETPNLKNLGLHLTFSDKENPSLFPDLLHLDKLETLKFEYQTLGMVPFHIRHESFPPSLKKLTLVGSHVKWEEMSIVELLPNLEVLKIKDNFFSGPIWETMEEGFCSLKFLKLSHVDLQQWISCSSHFPRLEHLVLNGCLDLQEILTEIEEIDTLHTVEVYRSSKSTIKWAEEIKINRREKVKVLVYKRFQEF